MKIIITESQYKILKEIFDDDFDQKKISIGEWEEIWNKLRKEYKGFNRADYEIFPFGGLFFFYDEKGGFLELPEQELSDWNRDLDRAKEILDNYLKRIKTAIENSDLNIKLKVGPKYSMKIYKV